MDIFQTVKIDIHISFFPLSKKAGCYVFVRFLFLMFFVDFCFFFLFIFSSTHLLIPFFNIVVHCSFDFFHANFSCVPIFLHEIYIEYYVNTMLVQEHMHLFVSRISVYFML